MLLGQILVESKVCRTNAANINAVRTNVARTNAHSTNAARKNIVKTIVA